MKIICKNSTSLAQLQSSYLFIVIGIMCVNWKTLSMQNSLAPLVLFTLFVAVCLARSGISKPNLDIITDIINRLEYLEGDKTLAILLTRSSNQRHVDACVETLLRKSTNCLAFIHDPYTVANILTRFLVRIPDGPVIPASTVTRITATSDSKFLESHLPKTNWKVLKRLFSFLRSVRNNHRSTRLSDQQLSEYITPILLAEPYPTGETDMNIIVRIIGLWNQLILRMIDSKIAS